MKNDNNTAAAAANGVSKEEITMNNNTNMNNATLGLNKEETTMNSINNEIKRLEEELKSVHEQIDECNRIKVMNLNDNVLYVQQHQEIVKLTEHMKQIEKEIRKCKIARVEKEDEMDDLNGCLSEEMKIARFQSRINTINDTARCLSEYDEWNEMMSMRVELQRQLSLLQGEIEEADEEIMRGNMVISKRWLEHDMDSYYLEELDIKNTTGTYINLYESNGVEVIAVYQDKQVRFYRTSKNNFYDLDYKSKVIALQDEDNVRTIIEDNSQKGKLVRHKFSSEITASVYLYSNKDNFRISVISTTSTLRYKRNNNGKTQLRELTIFDAHSLREAIDREFMLVIAHKKHTASMRLNKETLDITAKMNNRPMRSYVRFQSILDMLKRSSGFSEVPDSFYDVFKEHLRTMLPEDVKKHMAYENTDIGNGTDELANLLKISHYPNTVHVIHSPRHENLAWTGTMRKKEYMSKAELLKAFYPALSNKAAKRLAASKLLVSNEIYNDRFAVYLLHLLEDTQDIEYMANKLNTLPVVNTIYFSSEKPAISFRTLDRKLKEFGLLDIIKKRLHNYIVKLKKEPEQSAEATQTHSAFYNQQLNTRLFNEVFRDSISMFIRFASNIQEGDKDEFLQVMAGRKTEKELHDGLMIVVRHQNERAALIRNEAAKKLQEKPFEYEQNILTLEETIADVEFRLPKDMGELKDVGTKMNICVGYGGYGQAMHRKEMVIVNAFRGDEPIICVELNADCTEARQIKLKYNGVITKGSDLDVIMSEWLEKHSITSVNHNDYVFDDFDVE